MYYNEKRVLYNLSTILEKPIKNWFWNRRRNETNANETVAIVRRDNRTERTRDSIAQKNIIRKELSRIRYAKKRRSEISKALRERRVKIRFIRELAGWKSERGRFTRRAGFRRASVGDANQPFLARRPVTEFRRHGALSVQSPRRRARRRVLLDRPADNSGTRTLPLQSSKFYGFPLYSFS